MNENNYLQLREAGMNEFSVSLEFPNERHDEFGRQPSLYKHLEHAFPRLAKLGFRAIILNTAITKANLREILPLAKKAIEWGVGISYLAYTVLRPSSEDYRLSNGEDLRILREAINELMILREQGTHLVNPELTLRDTLKFFE